MLVSNACDVNIQLLIAEQLTRNKLIETKLNLCLYLCDYIVYHTCFNLYDIVLKT